VNGLDVIAIVFSIAAVLVVALAGAGMHEGAKDLRQRRQELDDWAGSLAGRELQVRRRESALQWTERISTARQAQRAAAQGADPYAWAARSPR
jgi:hypothetical protein